jgi:hypothetical protein
MKMLVVALLVTNVLSGTALYLTDGGVCQKLIDMQEAELAKQVEAEKRMHDFLTNQGKPIPLPEFKERGL